MNNNKTHILVISQYFYPEQFRINDICQEWVKRGYDVTVVTGIPNYPKGKFYDGYGLFKKRKEKYNGINIVRIPLIPRGNNNSVMLALNYLSFVVSGYFWTKSTKLKSDYVFIYETSPITQAFIGKWYSKRENIPCYLYVMDLWPESVQVITGTTNKFILSALDKMVNSIYSGCDKIFTSSQSFIDEIKKRDISESKLEFWPQYAEDFYKPLNKDEVDVKEIPNDNNFNIIFAGNIGEAQGLGILPDVAIILKDRGKNVRFNIVGDGRYKDTLLLLVKQKNVEDMFNFIDKQPATRIPELFDACDASLICLSRSPLFSITIPAKTQSCLACGIPIIVSADGEIQNIINDAECGVCSDAGNINCLVDNICKMTEMSQDKLINMSSNALKYSKDYYDKLSLLNKMDSYFNI
ncbi:MAG: glycosyltransferase family 4 protein [Oscillospiraceae bacterium]